MSLHRRHARALVPSSTTSSSSCSTLRDAFASTSIARAGIANAHAFTVAQDWLRLRSQNQSSASFIEYLRAIGALQRSTKDSSEWLDPWASPLDRVLRLASGVVPNFVNQDALGAWREEFMVCHNDVEYDNAWDDLSAPSGGALAGADRRAGGLPGHVVVTTKRDLNWDKANVCALGLEGTVEAKRQGVEFLLRMREAAMTYARCRGWTRLGLYFRFFGCEPEGEEERGIIRLHVVNLARAGPWLRRTAKINLPIDDVIEALGGRRASRRGAVIIVQPEAQDAPSRVSPLLPHPGSKDPSEDESVDVDSFIRRVTETSARDLENDFVMPDELKRQYNDAISRHDAGNAIRDAHLESLARNAAIVSEQADTSVFDAQFLSAYKSSSCPARVSKVLTEIYE